MFRLHCPKHNMNLGIKTEPVTPGVDAAVHIYNIYAPKPDIFCCSCPNRDMSGFYVEIQVIFPTVHSDPVKGA